MLLGKDLLLLLLSELLFLTLFLSGLLFLLLLALLVLLGFVLLVAGPLGFVLLIAGPLGLLGAGPLAVPFAVPLWLVAIHVTTLGLLAHELSKVEVAFPLAIPFLRGVVSDLFVVELDTHGEGSNQSSSKDFHRFFEDCVLVFY